MIFLDLEELLHVAERTLGVVKVHDAGLLESALARPRTTVFGDDAYPTLTEKAAALVHSLVKNHGLVDGNKRLGLAGLIAFLGMNGVRLTMSNDEAYAFIMSIAEGSVSEISDISERLTRMTEPWS